MIRRTAAVLAVVLCPALAAAQPAEPSEVAEPDTATDEPDSPEEQIPTLSNEELPPEQAEPEPEPREPVASPAADEPAPPEQADTNPLLYDPTTGAPPPEPTRQAGNKNAYGPAPPLVKMGERDAHLHDKLYLRLAIGPGLVFISRSAETDVEGAGGTWAGDGTISGLGLFHELSIGGTPREGLVLAGTVSGMQMPAASLSPSEGEAAELGGPLSLGVIGAIVDYFPDPQGGFHYGGGLGLAYLVANSPEGASFGTIGGAGLGVLGGIGHDFWTGAQWSVGGFARLMLAYISGGDSVPNLNGTEEDLMGALGLGISVLYH